MRFSVKYTHITFKRNIGAVGSGTLYLEDRALIVDGLFHSFHIPLVDRAFQQVIGVKSYRTIPYLTIKNYSAANFLNGSHRIIFENDNKKSVIVAFKLTDSSAEKLKEFSQRLESLRINAGMFLRQEGQNDR